MRPAIIFPILFSLITYQSLAQSGRIALIVAISEYNKADGWDPLNTDRDVQEMSAALERQGFAKDHIYLLRNKEATKENIINGIRKKLYENAKPGGLVYFHFSGHGQQVADYSGDELDRYDEALVPVDAKAAYDPAGYKGERHLTDDELMRELNAVRQKLGPSGQLVLAVDACFSGSMLRSAPNQPELGGVVRGSSGKMAPADWGGTALAKQEEGLEEYDSSNKLAPVISFTAAQSYQQNYEYMGGGSLSHALSSQLANLNEQMTYRGLFELVKTQMSSMVLTQTPQADGNLDYFVFGGKATVVNPFFRVLGVSEEGEWILDGGTLHGLTRGSTVGFFDRETFDFSSPRAKVTISESFSINALVPAMSQVDWTTTWVYLLHQAPGDLSVGVQLQLQDSSFEGAFRRTLQENGLFVDRPPYQCYLKQQSKGDSIYLSTSDGRSLLSVPPVEQKISAIINQLKIYSRAKYLREAGQLNNSRNKAGLEISLIPVQVVNKQAVKELPIEPFLDANGEVVLPVKTPIRLRIKNTGKVVGYFNLLDIQPDNKIAVLLPSGKDITISANDYYFSGKEGEEFEYPKEKGGYFEVAPPFGEEYLKIILSKTQFDFRNLIFASGSARGANSALEHLFEDLLGGTRGLTESFPVQEVLYFQKRFRIVPAKK